MAKNRANRFLISRGYRRVVLTGWPVMAMMIFNTSPDFPVSAVRRRLAQLLPLYRWQCGESDAGAQNEKAEFSRPLLILGRSGGDIVMVDVVPDFPSVPDPAFPPHRLCVRIGRPTVDDVNTVHRIFLGICAGFLEFCSDDAARCRLTATGDWLESIATTRMVELAMSGISVSGLDELAREVRAPAFASTKMEQLAPALLTKPPIEEVVMDSAATVVEPVAIDHHAYFPRATASRFGRKGL